MERFRFGLSSMGIQDLTEKDFRDFAECGLKELELSFSEDRYDTLDWEGIRRRASAYGIHLWSFHLPFSPFSRINPASFDPQVRRSTISYFESLMQRAADIGIGIMVVHPSAEPNREEEREERMKLAQESLSILCGAARKMGVTLAAENLPRTCLGRNSQEIRQLLASDDQLRVCFDTNHLLLQSEKEFIMDIGERIITTHVSDFDFRDERHWLPGEGKINWAEWVETMDQIGYEGPLLYEVAFDAPPSIQRRRLTVKDFRENHDRLVNRLPLPAIGTPALEN